jgi:hypothetical protein
VEAGIRAGELFVAWVVASVQPHFLASSHPKMALFRDLGVEPRVSLCDVHEYVSAETLALPACRTIDLAKNDSFRNRELRSLHPAFRDGDLLGLLAGRDGLTGRKPP